MVRREASHAGSWYTDDGPTLSSQLDQWLDQVPDTIDGVGDIPSKGARIIIAPHAGYSYSGPPAAWAYKSLDLSQAKRIFLLGPSHHVYLSGCALSQCDSYETPLGDLKLDRTTIEELEATGKFDSMSQSTDEDEHSLEMHLPYIYKVLSRSFSSPFEYPLLIPILVGATSRQTERSFGSLLAPYLRDPTSVFIISSDFCHWGLRFRYTYYLPSLSTSSSAHNDDDDSADATSGHTLRSGDRPPKDPPIHESIARLDRLAMRAVESGSHGTFLNNLRDTGNTVCGRHPIGLVMAALETLNLDASSGKGRFKFVRYERSSDCVRVTDSSVSYASAFAVL
ncbi:DUF52 domain-containing protein [Xylona heveae TC161]|uniref:DUF52 domain-containing protein n=1 Tax=Xylona heveae (strain CBS 132557 / TC161) TaxID=1328760 RepID=A0A165I0G8_XYLHT|nr:DUF52 domain-containing protein [Xylona heveae TC161]KZF24183.1 DUF52 domain-containing protein [Xylona heveae TC161]